MSQGSQSGTVGAYDHIIITLNEKSLFPNIYTVDFWDFRLMPQGSVSGGYVGRFELYNNSSTAHDYQVNWEYLS